MRRTDNLFQEKNLPDFSGGFRYGRHDDNWRSNRPCSGFCDSLMIVSDETEPHSHPFSNRILPAFQRGSEIFHEFDAPGHIFDQLRRLMLILYSHHSAELLSV